MCFPSQQEGSATDTVSCRPARYITASGTGVQPQQNHSSNDGAQRGISPPEAMRTSHQQQQGQLTVWGQRQELRNVLTKDKKSGNSCQAAAMTGLCATTCPAMMTCQFPYQSQWWTGFSYGLLPLPALGWGRWSFAAWLGLGGFPTMNHIRIAHTGALDVMEVNRRSERTLHSIHTS
jgi:hypothetical protein